MWLGACDGRPVLPGDYKGLVQADTTAVHQALLDILRTNGPAVEQESCADNSSLIQARYADGRPATFETRQLTDQMCALTIVIGDHGDRMVARELLERLRRTVEAPPP
jgi:hypothetical protein